MSKPKGKTIQPKSIPRFALGEVANRDEVSAWR